jgi:hypothetical protein
MSVGGVRAFLRIFLGLLFSILPVSDEIIAGFQFRALCKAQSLLIYEEGRLEGKTFVWAGVENEEVGNTNIPITKRVIRWVDASNEETVIQQLEFYASGGWLSRYIAFNGVTRPYTFNGVCTSEHKLKQLEKELKFTREYHYCPVKPSIKSPNPTTDVDFGAKMCGVDLNFFPQSRQPFGFSSRGGLHEFRQNPVRSTHGLFAMDDLQPIGSTLPG